MHKRVFEGSLEQLSAVRDFVAEAVLQCGCSEDDVFACQLAVDEAAANVFDHGYEGRPGRLEITVWREPEAVVTRLESDGVPYDPRWAPEPDTTLPLEQRPTGGLGVHFMKRLMMQVEYEFDEKLGNRLTLRRKLGKADGQAP